MGSATWCCDADCARLVSRRASDAIDSSIPGFKIFGEEFGRSTSSERPLFLLSGLCSAGPAAAPVLCVENGWSIADEHDSRTSAASSSEPATFSASDRGARGPVSLPVDTISLSAIHRSLRRRVALPVPTTPPTSSFFLRRGTSLPTRFPPNRRFLFFLGAGCRKQPDSSLNPPPPEVPEGVQRPSGSTRTVAF